MSRLLPYVARKAAVFIILFAFLSLVAYAFSVEQVRSTGLGALVGGTPSQLSLLAIRPGYLQWLWEFFTGSASLGELGNVSTLFAYLPNTLDLLVPALVIGFVVGLPVGIWLGRWKGAGSSALAGLADLVSSTPAFVSALLCASVFAFDLGWLPGGGTSNLLVGGGPDLRHWLIPGGALCILSAAIFARIAYSNVALALRTARDAPPDSVHVLRDTTLGTLVQVGRAFGLLVVAGMAVEAALGWHGILFFFVEAFYQSDLAAMGDVIFLVSLLVLIVCLLFEVLPVCIGRRSVLLDRWTSGFETSSLSPETVIPQPSEGRPLGGGLSRASIALLVCAGFLFLLAIYGFFAPYSAFTYAFTSSPQRTVDATLASLPHDLFPACIGAGVAAIIGLVLALVAGTSRTMNWLVLLVLDLVGTLPALFFLFLFFGFNALNSSFAGTLFVGTALGVLGAPVMAIVAGRSLAAEVPGGRDGLGTGLLGGASLLVASNVILVATMGFLGFLANPASSSMGYLVAEGSVYLGARWWATFIPSVAIVVVVFVFTSLGTTILRGQADDDNVIDQERAVRTVEQESRE